MLGGVEVGRPISEIIWIGAAAAFGLAPALALPTDALAMDYSLQGVLDARVVAGMGERAWQDGGLAKGRFGQGEDGARLTEAHLSAGLIPFDGFELNSHVRIEHDQKTLVDVIEAYARWQPDFGLDLPLTLKIGAFFPPISLENDGLAWAGLYTITPSAINSWIGEELRTIGAEAHYIWSTGRTEIGLTGALFGWNDPAGTLLGDRGWALHDRWSGLIEDPRLPDNFAVGGRPPARLDLFREIDGRAGWYAAMSVRQRGLPRVSVLYYDNNADPTAIEKVRAWDTRFWSLGIDTILPGNVQLMAQGMVGNTVVHPNAINRRDTDFQAAYLLLGYTMGDWTFGGRFDLFSSSETTKANRAVRFGEHGQAYTASVAWRLHDNVTLASEVLHTDSHRAHRRLFGDGPDRADSQLQISLRVNF